MDTKHNALKELHETLTSSIATYNRALNDFDELPLRDKVRELVDRRTENADQVAQYLKRSGVDIASDAADASEYSSLDWTSAKLAGEDGIATLVRQHEDDVLAAYDKAIVPCTSDDNEFDFLKDQYDELSRLVDALNGEKAAA